MSKHVVNNDSTYVDTATNNAGTPKETGDGGMNDGQSYCDTTLEKVTQGQAKGIVSKLYKQAEQRKTKNGPAGYYDYIEYPHRKKILQQSASTGESKNPVYNSTGLSDPGKRVRIGDCMFIIPPEFISVNATTGNESIQGIRQGGSIQIKHGYTTKEITINMTLNGMNQINGYPVESPMGYDYYVDGLRTLISEFRYTPFVPIENTFINITQGIGAVAFRSLVVETIEGFPESLNVQLTLQEFNTAPYLEEDNILFDDYIDWDLYRWFIQRPMHKNHKGYLPKIKTKRLTSKFEFKIIKASSITEADSKIKKEEDKNDELNVNIKDDDNYDLIVSDKDDIELTYVNFDLNNILPSIQMAYHYSPTLQYMGCTDTNFTMTFETQNFNTVRKFEELNSKNNAIVRQFRKKNCIGFIKVDNEIINLTGTTHMILETVQTSTVPGFPGLYKITLKCISYDANQKEREKLIAFRPFPGGSTNGHEIPQGRKGTESDLISQTQEGKANKIKQELMAEKKLSYLEMYPDLALPKYSAVDGAINKIAAFRKKKKLTAYDMKKLPRSVTVTPNGGSSSYGGYVEPDFYVRALRKTKDLDLDNALSSKKSTKRKSSNAKKNTSTASATTLNDEITKEINDSSYGDDIGDEANTGYTFPEIQGVPDKVIEPTYNLGYEPGETTRKYKGITSLDEQDISTNTEDIKAVGVGTFTQESSENNPMRLPKVLEKKTGNVFVDILCSRADAKCGYATGASVEGEILTPTYLNKLKQENPTDPSLTVSRKWMNRQVWDSSSFICWGLIQIGLKEKGFSLSAGQMGKLGTQVLEENLRIGDICYNSHHAAVYIGNNRTVEAQKASTGIVYGKIGWQSYNYVRIDGLEKCCNTFVNDNPCLYGEQTSSQLYENTYDSNSVGKSIDYDNMQSKEIYKINQNTVTKNKNIKYQQEEEKVKLGDFGIYAIDRYNDIIEMWSRCYNLDPNFVKCIIRLESEGKKYATSSSNDCVGLMQISQKFYKIDNPYEPSNNIKAGCHILKRYGILPYVKYDKERWLCAYNLGANKTKSIYVTNEIAITNEVENYIEKYDEYYEILMNNGGYAGNRLTPKTQVMSELLDEDKVWISSTSDILPKYQYRDMVKTETGEEKTANYKDKFIENTTYLTQQTSKLKNQNAGRVRKRKIKDFNIDEMCPVSSPIDNPAIYNDDEFMSAMKEDIWKDDDNTSTISPIVPKANNETYNNLPNTVAATSPSPSNTNLPAKEDTVSINNNSGGDSGGGGKATGVGNLSQMLVDETKYSQRGTLTRAFPSYIFVIIDEHGDFINEKKLWSNYYVYKSVVDIQVYSAHDNPVSTARVILSNYSQNLSTINKSVKTSDMVKNGEYGLLNSTWYNLTGSLIKEKITPTMLKYRNDLHSELFVMEGTRIHIRMGYGSNPAKYPTVFNGTVCQIDEGELVTLVAQGDGAELSNEPVSDKANATNESAGLHQEVSNIVAELLTRRKNEFLYTLSEFLPMDRIEYTSAFGIEHFGLCMSSFSGGFDMRNQDDILKNVYLGTYNATAFVDGFLIFDGEENIKFYAYQKVPWDIMKMCEKAMPEFIAYPRPFMFEHRFFYGCPHWLYSSGYGSSSAGAVHEAKTFAQLHLLDSVSNIVQNNITIDTKELFTNAIGMYTLGGDIASTPIVMSDDKIDWSKQSTKIIDTTSIQNFALMPNILDKILDWTSLYDNGKQTAIRVCVSELQNAWRNTYAKEIVTLGMGEVQPYDFFCLNDNYIHMYGVAMVRQVCHNMNIKSGYTTAITPGMVTTNTLKYSGLQNVVKSMIGLGAAVGNVFLVKAMIVSAGQSIKSVLAATKAGQRLSKGTQYAKSFINGPGKSMYNYLKNGTIVSKGSEFCAKAGGILKRLPGVSKLADIGIGTAKVTKTVVTAGRGLFSLAKASIPGILVDMVLGIVITKITDMFSYRNCVNAYPLYLEDKPFIGGCTGQEKLIPGSDDSGVD